MKRGRSGPIGSRMTIATLAAALLFGVGLTLGNVLGGRLGDWRQVQYVPVQFRVLQSDGSFAATSRTSWGYVFARNGDDERWRLVDQGVG